MLRRASLLAVVASVASLLAGSAGAANYPIAADGTINVNLMRRYDPFGFLGSFAISNGTGVNTDNNRPISGDQWMMQWSNDGGAGDPNATASLQLTLDSAYSIKKFVHTYGGLLPQKYEIKVSTTGFGSMTSVVTQLTGSTEFDLLTTPVTAKYIEYTWTGTTASKYVQLKEFEAYADAASGPISDLSGFDIISNGLATISDATVDTVNGGWVPADALTNVIDRVVPGNPGLQHLDTFIRGKDNLGPPFFSGDARFVVDLNDTYGLRAVNLGFYHGQGWGQGARIELSLDNVNYSTVFNSNSYVDLVSAFFPKQMARYIRVTNYGSEGGALVEMQAFVPEPSSLALLAVGAVGLLRRRRAAR